MSYRSSPDGYDMRKWSVQSGKRRRRTAAAKWLILLSFVLMYAVALYDLFAPTGDRHGIPNLIGVLMPAIIAASLSPFARGSWLTAKGRATYDEFERTAYASAAQRAHFIFLGVITTFFVYLYAAASLGWPLPLGPRGWATWGLVLLLTGAALPLLLAEFMVPLPPAAEEIDD